MEPDGTYCELLRQVELMAVLFEALPDDVPTAVHTARWAFQQALGPLIVGADPEEADLLAAKAAFNGLNGEAVTWILTWAVPQTSSLWS